MQICFKLMFDGTQSLTVAILCFASEQLLDILLCDVMPLSTIDLIFFKCDILTAMELCNARLSLSVVMLCDLRLLFFPPVTFTTIPE